MDCFEALRSCPIKTRNCRQNMSRVRCWRSTPRLLPFQCVCSFTSAKVQTTSVADKVAPITRASCNSIYTVSPCLMISPCWLQTYVMRPITIKAMNVPAIPNISIGPMFLKNLLLFMLYPAPRIRKGSIKLKKISESNLGRSPRVDSNIKPVNKPITRHTPDS